MGLHPRLVDIVRGFLEAIEGFRVVLDPELRAALLEVSFHRRATGKRLFLVRLIPGGLEAVRSAA